MVYPSNAPLPKLYPYGVWALFLKKWRRSNEKKGEKDLVRPGTAGLLIGIECSRVRDRSWMYLTSFVTTQIGVEQAAVQRKIPDCVVVGFQLYSARTFHVTLSPWIYKGG